MAVRPDAAQCIERRIMQAAGDRAKVFSRRAAFLGGFKVLLGSTLAARMYRSEEHTSELQSHSDLVCRLLLEKKKTKKKKKKSGTQYDRNRGK